MGVYKLSTAGGLATPRTNYSSFLAGNPAFEAGEYQSIATVTVGSGGASDVTFSSIPSDYTHLQIRGIQLTSGGNWALRLQVNSDTGNNYATHYLGGYGSGTFSEGTTSTSYINLGVTGTVASTFGASVVDILDYKNTNKFKTVRSFDSFDENGGGYVVLASGLWQNTNAITSLKLFLQNSNNFMQYTQFALYGIKGS